MKQQSIRASHQPDATPATGKRHAQTNTHAKSGQAKATAEGMRQRLPTQQTTKTSKSFTASLP
jgi:hypothetical protein